MTETEPRQKVVLVYPRFPEALAAVSLPMGPLYVGSYLEAQGYEVVLLDANNFGGDQSFAGTLRDELASASALGLSVMTGQIASALEISKLAKQTNPTLPVIWGGVHATLFSEQTVRCEHVDFAVRGEGERTLEELLRALAGDGALEDVRGITFRQTDSDEIIVTQEREPLDLDSLPSVKWKLLETISPGQRLKLSELVNRTLSGIYLQTGRGCPHRCTFCINSVLMNKYRDRRSDLVIEDIRELVQAGVDRIWFMDENFFTSKKRVTEIITGIEQLGLKFKWYATVRANYLRPNYVDSDFLARLQKAGLDFVGIGAESGSPRVLKLLKKDITVEETLNAARMLSKARMKASFSFMIGLPGEEKDDMLKTLRLIESITAIDTSFSFRILGPQVYRPYPGSELYLECLQRGLREPTTLEEWANSPYTVGETIGRAVVNPDAYPWIGYPSRFINNMVFYSALLGVRLRYRPVTWLLRTIASLRCRGPNFTFPAERLLYNIAMKTGAYKLVRIKSVLNREVS